MRRLVPVVKKKIETEQWEAGKQHLGQKRAAVLVRNIFVVGGRIGIFLGVYVANLVSTAPEGSAYAALAPLAFQVRTHSQTFHSALKAQAPYHQRLLTCYRSAFTAAYG
jgi:hypothetical protein